MLRVGVRRACDPLALWPVYGVALLLCMHNLASPAARISQPRVFIWGLREVS